VKLRVRHWSRIRRGQSGVHGECGGRKNHCEERRRYAETRDAGIGGKSPNVFFADADWESGGGWRAFGVFINQGEVCSAGSRVLVEKKIYTKFVEA